MRRHHAVSSVYHVVAANVALLFESCSHCPATRAGISHRIDALRVWRGAGESSCWGWSAFRVAHFDAQAACDPARGTPRSSHSSMSTRANTTQSKRLGRSGRLCSSTFICAVARGRGFFTAGSTCFQPLPCHSCVSLYHSLAPLHGGARLCVCRRGMCAAHPDPTMLRPQPRTMLQL